MTARRPLVIDRTHERAAEIAVTDTLQLPTPSTANASANFPHGTAPSSPVNGDIWTTSAGLFARINGVTVGPFVSSTAGGNFREGTVTKPSSSSFSWVNQGDASVADGTNSMVVTLPANASTNTRILVETAPSTPFDIYARIDGVKPMKQFVSHGILLRNSTNGRFLALWDSARLNAGTNWQWSVLFERWASATSFNAEVTVSPDTGSRPKWFRMNVTSTTATAYVSTDGLDWVSLGSDTLASYLTATGSADQIGVAAAVSNGASTMFVHSFGTSAPA